MIQPSEIAEVLSLDSSEPHLACAANECIVCMSELPGARSSRLMAALSTGGPYSAGLTDFMRQALLMTIASEPEAPVNPTPNDVEIFTSLVLSSLCAGCAEPLLDLESVEATTASGPVAGGPGASAGFGSAPGFGLGSGHGAAAAGH